MHNFSAVNVLSALTKEGERIKGSEESLNQRTTPETGLDAVA